MYLILYLITGEVISGYAQKTGSFTEINKLGLHQKYKYSLTILMWLYSRDFFWLPSVNTKYSY